MTLASLQLHKALAPPQGAWAQHGVASFAPRPAPPPGRGLRLHFAAGTPLGRMTTRGVRGHRPVLHLGLVPRGHRQDAVVDGGLVMDSTSPASTSTRSSTSAGHRQAAWRHSWCAASRTSATTRSSRRPPSAACSTPCLADGHSVGDVSGGPTGSWNR
ncbi:hypothetical protein QJS66_16005 [Kocuria rhizophila]|nr:hypothetical protein QJS66_16005 [Kocuria rhizophila]